MTTGVGFESGLGASSAWVSGEGEGEGDEAGVDGDELEVLELELELEELKRSAPHRVSIDGDAAAETEGARGARASADAGPRRAGRATPSATRRSERAVVTVDICAVL